MQAFQVLDDGRFAKRPVRTALASTDQSLHASVCFEKGDEHTLPLFLHWEEHGLSQMLGTDFYRWPQHERHTN